MIKRCLVFCAILFTTTTQALPVDMDKHLQELETDGVTVLKRLYTPGEIQAYRQELRPIVEEVHEILKTPGKPRIFHNDGVKTESRFWPIGQSYVLQAGPGRFDTTHGINQGLFGKDRLQHHPYIEALVKQLLHSRYVNHTGVVYSAPGSGDQYWHRDTDNMADSDSDGTKLIAMDDFYYTVLIPLVAMDKRNGSTEFKLGTHRKTAEAFDTSISKQFELEIGDVLIFNGKINHRGRGNDSDSDRPVIYNVYYKGWYNDRYREGVAIS